MIYTYRIHLGIAYVSKMKIDGEEVDQKPRLIGRYKTEAGAKEACEKHFEKASNMARAAGRVPPQILFV